MSTNLRLDVEAIKVELINLFDEKPLSLSKHAKGIGVTQHTLINFLYNKRITSRITFVKIRNYIDKNKADIKTD